MRNGRMLQLASLLLGTAFLGGAANPCWSAERHAAPLLVGTWNKLVMMARAGNVSTVDLQSQGQGILEGTVVLDPDCAQSDHSSSQGKAARTVSITAVSADKRITRVTHPDPQGNYRFILPAGNYQLFLTSSCPLDKQDLKRSVTIKPGQKTRLNANPHSGFLEIVSPR